MKKLFAAAVLALGSIGSTMAADPAVEVVADPAYDWSGVYVGVQGGYGWGETKWGINILPASNDVDLEGALGGLYLGYNHQLANRLVVGAEADIGLSDINGSVNGLYIGDRFYPLNEGAGKLEWTGAVRARVGYALGRLLPYATAGIAFGEYEFIAEYPADSSSGKETQTGWTVGAGAEYAVTDHLTTRIDYRYTDLGDASYTIVGPNIGYETEVDLRTHEVRFGVAYKF